VDLGPIPYHAVITVSIRPITSYGDWKVHHAERHFLKIEAAPCALTPEDATAMALKEAHELVAEAIS
jgi:hypothetical protein